MKIRRNPRKHNLLTNHLIDTFVFIIPWTIFWVLVCAKHGDWCCGYPVMSKTLSTSSASTKSPFFFFQKPFKMQTSTRGQWNELLLHEWSQNQHGCWAYGSVFLRILRPEVDLSIGQLALLLRGFLLPMVGGTALLEASVCCSSEGTFKDGSHS